MKKRLSKSQYLKGRRCLKRVWLYNFRRDLMASPSDFQQTIFTQGHEVGRLAHQLFPGGELIHEDYRNPEGAVQHTQTALAEGKTILYEPAFLFDDVIVRVDILKKNQDVTWDLIEVKSATDIKKENPYDCAIQKYVLTKLGIPLRQTCLMHLNSSYRLNGTLDLRQLFSIVPMDEEIQTQLDEIPAWLTAIQEHLNRPDQEPHVELAALCNNPYECEFKGHCWANVTRDSIHYISRISDKKRRELNDLQVTNVSDVPEDFELSELQLIQVQAHKNRLPHIETEKIQEHLKQLQHPIHYLDFETYGFAIPKYQGTKPYLWLPFQYSLHVQQTAESALHHFEFLHDTATDPRESFIQHLLQQVQDTGSIVTYSPFEATILKTLLSAYPEHETKIQGMIRRIWDLATPFAKKWFYHPEFGGRSSIKVVLPVLVPDLSYDSLAIGEGGTAQAKYLEMIDEKTSDGTKSEIKRNLLEYCKQDTLAMVRIHEKLTSQFKS